MITTIELNGNTTVPVEVIKVIADSDLKVTFVVDGVRSWKTDGAEITAPAAAELAIITINGLKTDAMRGIEGTQFKINDTGIPTSLEMGVQKCAPIFVIQHAKGIPFRNALWSYVQQVRSVVGACLSEN